MPRGQGQNKSGFTPVSQLGSGPDFHDEVTISLPAGAWDALLSDKGRDWARQRASLRMQAKNTIKSAIPNPAKRKQQCLDELVAQRPFVDTVAIGSVLGTLIDRTQVGKRNSASKKLGGLEIRLDRYPNYYRIQLNMPKTTFAGRRLYQFEQCEKESVEKALENKFNIEESKISSESLTLAFRGVLK